MSTAVQSDHSLFYLCAGFHRSGTSLVAQSLANGGMHMGDDLMGASFSNILGHVEDMPVVRLHDKIFQINGSDWRFHHNSALVKPFWFKNYIHRYLEKRAQRPGVNGVKDPRACFFLNHWQVAGGANMRYVLVYRHWSTAANSLLSRASRHLLNGTAPILNNKVNISFFQKPRLAFDMWQASNQEILAFYQQHPNQCLLISQDAYVNQHVSFAGHGQKIGLDDGYFDNNVIEPSLTTGSVPESVLGLLSQHDIEQLDSTWKQLQALADVPAPTTPRVTSHLHLLKPATEIVDNTPDFVSAAPPLIATKGFDLSLLPWQEVFGLLARIPENEMYVELFDELLKRPFTTADNYFTLAKIAHKNRYFIATKLCKMRGMQIQATSWVPSDWSLYTEDNTDWLGVADAELPTANPYSLLPKDKTFITDAQLAEIIALNFTQLSEFIESDNKRYGRQWLSSLLLQRTFLADEYRSIAGLAASHGWHDLREFCLFKTLRFGVQPDLLLELGDFYFSQAIIEKAQECFDGALVLMPGSAALLARLANVMMATEQMDKASGYLHRAKRNAPNHPAVLRSAKRLKALLAKQDASAKQEALLGSSENQYVMPLVESYEQVLNVLRDNEAAGQALDRYNLRMSFILRDNLNWLCAGLLSVPDKARLCLAEKVYSHWSKLWPIQALHTELGLPLPREEQQKHCLSHMAATNQRILITLCIDDMAKADELLSFVEFCPSHADLLIECALSDEPGLSELLMRYGVKQVEFLRHKFNQQYSCEYDVVCRLNTSVVGLNKKPANILLQQLFALVGDPLVVAKILGAFEQDETLGLVVAPYHPSMPQQIDWGSDFDGATNRLQKLQLELPQSLGLFPLGNMYWARPKALSGAFKAGLDKENETLFLKLLPTFVTQAGFKTTATHLL